MSWNHLTNLTNRSRNLASSDLTRWFQSNNILLLVDVKQKPFVRVNQVLGSCIVAKWNLGEVKIETMLVSGRPSDWFVGLTGSSLWLLPVRLLACLPLCSVATLFATLKSFPPLPCCSGKYQAGKYPTDCISVTVPLVEASSRVAMDTSFHLHDYFPDPKLIYCLWD